MFAYDSVGGGLGAAAIHTSGMGKGQLTQQIIANAVRIFNAGGMGLKGSGVQIGEAFKAQVQALYATPGTGKPVMTKIGMATVIHTPSVPGQPPAPLTGDLRDSVQYGVVRKPGRGAGGKFVPSFGRTEIVIFTRNPYAYDLEMGTRGKGKQIAERPAWRVVHNKWAVPGPGSRMVQAAIEYGFPDNFIAAERRAASKMMLGNPKMVFGRETAAGR